MGQSTFFHWKKIVVVFKTLYYYTKLIFFPKRMGLYHTFGYHYEVPSIESEDKYFWAGVLLFCLGAIGIVIVPAPAQFSIAWFVAFIFMFLNWITIHQFVSERYCWIPAFGACLLVAWTCLTYHLLPIFYIVFGISLMRTWAHIPTFDNELKFYDSNMWNFPNSEVAIGNKGVTLMRMGMVGAAHDMWQIGTRMNKEYDVNWYNLYSIMKSNGQLDMARSHLVTALSARTCHFTDMWIKELVTLDNIMVHSIRGNEIKTYLDKIQQDPTQKEQADNLQKAIQDIEKMEDLLKGERTKREQDIAKKMAEVMQTAENAVQSKTALEQEKKLMEQMTSYDNIMLNKFNAIDAVHKAIKERTSTPPAVSPPLPLV